MDALTEFRAGKDEFFKSDHHSPIPNEARHHFDGLNYFPPNPDLIFELPVQEADGAELKIQTTDGETRVYRRSGRVRFTVDGVDTELTLYDTGHPGFFLPFRDGTSGKETYGAGRYLDLEPNSDGSITLDFNYAYNPFCVYDEAYSCPLPPPENWLTVRIEAGEQNYPE